MTAFTGTFRVAVSGVAEGDAPALLEVLDAFAGALELGMFPPATVDGRPAPSFADGTAVAVFEGRAVPAVAFRVLAGMLTWFAGVVAPIGAREATVGGGRDNLLLTAAPFPGWPQPLPFDTDLEVPGGNAPPLLVSIGLQRPVVPAARPALISPVRVWHALLQGGYPREDDREGESGSGPALIRFTAPATLTVESENWRADKRCFAPLFHLLARWHRDGIPVDLVSIE